MRATWPRLLGQFLLGTSTTVRGCSAARCRTAGGTCSAITRFAAARGHDDDGRLGDPRGAASLFRCRELVERALLVGTQDHAAILPSQVARSAFSRASAIMGFVFQRMKFCAGVALGRLAVDEFKAAVVQAVLLTQLSCALASISSASS